MTSRWTTAWDAVVVGGGHNGLVAANYLARAGRSVLILERGGQLGGAAVSFRAFSGVDVRLSRYSYLVSLLPKQIIDELNLPIRLRRRAISSYTPIPGTDNGLLVDTANPDRTRASFNAVTGNDTDFPAWQRFYARTQRLAERVFPTLTEPLRGKDELRAIVDDDPAWLGLFERPVSELLTAEFADDTVRGVVLTDALIGTFASADDPSLKQNRCLLYHLIGNLTGDWDVPIGGMGAVTGALIDAARRQACSPAPAPLSPRSTRTAWSATPATAPNTPWPPGTYWPTSHRTPSPPCSAEPRPTHRKARSSR